MRLPPSLSLCDSRRSFSSDAGEDAIYKRPVSREGSTNAIRSRIYSGAPLCAPLSLSPSREVLEDGPGASASANTGLSSRAIHLHARGEIISVTRNTPAAAGKFLAPT
ncbi:hypothetical protein CAJAP_09057 [Camponotus japonicus]